MVPDDQLGQSHQLVQFHRSDLSIRSVRLDPFCLSVRSVRYLEDRLDPFYQMDRLVQIQLALFHRLGPLDQLVRFRLALFHRLDR